MLYSSTTVYVDYYTTNLFTRVARSLTRQIRLSYGRDPRRLTRSGHAIFYVSLSNSIELSDYNRLRQIYYMQQTFHS